MRDAIKAVAVSLAAAACLAMGDNGARVVAVYPAGASVPANLLRVSITFDRPQGGTVLPRLSLTGARLSPGQAPFLDEELWTPDDRTLTLLLDPARVKTGLLANKQFGRVLQPGETVTLSLDGKMIKRWTVSLPFAKGPDPVHWIIHPPQPGTRDPLVLDLDQPIDALDRDLIAISSPDGRPIAGTIALQDSEKSWSFTPATPWTTGRYRVMISPDLEDAAGNAVAQPFEVNLRTKAPDRTNPVSVPFDVP